LLALFLLAAPIVQAQSTGVESPRPTMRAIFEEMKALIPLSLDEIRWSSPASQQKILAALGRLEVAVAALEAGTFTVRRRYWSASS
jgi:hypothetical protein